jgi:hypothetical protein
MGPCATIGSFNLLSILSSERGALPGFSPGPIWTSLQVSDGASPKELKSFSGRCKLGNWTVHGGASGAN